MINKNKKELDTKELNEVISLSKKILNVLYILMIVGIVLGALFIMVYSNILKVFLSVLKVISPLFIGFVIAWLFNPLVKKLRKKGINKVLSALIVYAAFIIIVVIFIRVFIPVLYSQINDLIGSLPSVISKINDFIDEFVMSFNTESIDLSGVKDTIISNFETIIIDYTSKLPNILINLIINLFSAIGVVVMGLVVGLYMLFDFDSIQSFFLKLIPKKHRHDIETLLNNIGNEVRKSVNGTLLVALVVFVCDTIGFTIVGLEAPLLLGFFCGVTDLIPYIGPYIGGAAATLMGFSQGTMVGVTVLIICIIVQLVESYVLQPIVMSKAVSIHPVAIIVGLLIFGYFFGIIGMVLATPILAILKVIILFIKDKKEVA